MKIISAAAISAIVLSSVACSNEPSLVVVSKPLDSLAAQQLFSISTERDTTIFSAAGIRIYIPAGVFTLNGPDTGKGVNVVVREADHISAKDCRNIIELKNMCDSTDFFLRIEAFAGAKPLSLKEGKWLTVHLPKNGAAGKETLHYYTGGEGSGWRKDTAACLCPMSLRMVYERLDFTGRTKAHDRTLKRLWLKDTSNVKTVEAYFNRFFDFCSVDYAQLEATRPRLTLKVNNEGNIYGLEFKGNSESAFAKQISLFLLHLPPVALHREKKGDTASVVFGMAFEVQHTPPANQLAEGYLSSIDKMGEHKTPVIHFYRDIAAAYSVFNVKQLGWTLFSNNVNK
jgi:hypothetical protein